MRPLRSRVKTKLKGAKLFNQTLRSRVERLRSRVERHGLGRVMMMMMTGFWSRRGVLGKVSAGPVLLPAVGVV